MAKTKIEWCDETVNPITGCTAISAGCLNCYARRMAFRQAGRNGYNKTAPFGLTFHEDKLQYLTKRRRHPARIFVCSMSDIFHEDAREGWQDQVISQIFKNSLVLNKYLFLTKRPLNIYEDGRFMNPNLWFGTSVEHQDYRHRISELILAPVRRRFLSVEPMLGALDIRTLLSTKKIEWVICGRETGGSARAFNFAWAHLLYLQCREFKVPFFFKNNQDKKYKWPFQLPEEFPVGLRPEDL